MDVVKILPVPHPPFGRSLPSRRHAMHAMHAAESETADPTLPTRFTPTLSPSSHPCPSSSLHWLPFAVLYTYTCLDGSTHRGDDYPRFGSPGRADSQRDLPGLVGAGWKHEMGSVSPHSSSRPPLVLLPLICPVSGQGLAGGAGCRMAAVPRFFLCSLLFWPSRLPDWDGGVWAHAVS